MATEFINVVVSQRGAQQVRRELEDIGAGADRSARSLALLTRALGAVGLGFGLDKLRETVDGYTNLSNRLRLVATDSFNLAQLQDAVFRSAQRTRTPLEAMAQLYSRTALNAAALGLSQADMLRVTEAVAQSFQISGATAAEASGSIIQFTQGLAQGTLRGQELNSVLEQAPRLAKAIADGIGVGVYDLKRMGEQGKITAELIVEALLKAGPELQAEFAKLNPTIESAFTVLQNGFTRVIGQMDQAIGASATFSRMLIELGSNTELLRNLIIGVGIALAAILVPTLATATVAAVAFTLALATNPLTWIAAAIAVLVLFGDQIKVSADGVVSLMDWLKALGSVLMDFVGPTMQWLGAVFGQVWDFIVQTWGGISDWFAQNFGQLVELGAIFYRSYVGIFNGLVQAIVAAFGNLPAAVEAIFKNMMNGVVDIVQGGLNAVIFAINAVLAEVLLPEIPTVDLQDFKMKLSDDAANMSDVLGDAFKKGFEDGDVAAQEGLAAVTGVLDEINKRARRNAIDRMSLGRGPKPDGTLPEVPGVAIPREEPVDKKAETRLAKLLRDIKGAQGELEQGQRDLDVLLSRGSITVDEYSKKLRELRIAALDAGTSLGDGLATGLLKVQDRLADVADTAENMVVNAFKNAEDALVTFVTTGKLDFKKFVDDLLADLARLAIQKAILGPIAGWMGGLFGFKDGGLVQGFADGGKVKGPGTGTSDSILAWLSNGEFVVNAESAKMFMPLLEALNDNKALPRRAEGGPVGRSSLSAMAGFRGLGGSDTNVQVYDQRGSGAPVTVTKSRRSDGGQDVRVLVRDELESANSKTRRARERETRETIRRNRRVGNI